MKKLFLALALIVMSSAVVSAQKFGYINSQELLSIMPDAIKADSSLKTYAKTFQDQLEALQKEYETKLKFYQENVSKMTEAVKEAKEGELTTLQQRFQALQQSAEERVAKRRGELMNPILERADKAIKDVATANNYDYIFDQSNGSLLFAKPTDNILPLVKSKLGIK